MLLRAVCLLLIIAARVDVTRSALASTWYQCNCRWDDWKAWSECDSDCFGERVRTRSVWLTESSVCDEFTDCATNDEGSDWQGCNEVCYNGGSASGFLFAPCQCQIGYYGSCCTERVNCGAPDNIVDGSVSVTSTYYGGEATYNCNTYYNMTTGDSVRICQNDFSWSGTDPECIFAYHCNSSPCMNDGTCVNLLGDFRCDCTDGWDGKLCDIDVQPPVMTNCSGNIDVNATEVKVRFEWSPPSFFDPMGNDLDIVSNYPSPSFKFPWGDYTVQYVATKPSNGMVTECVFQVKVRPTPCEELNVPQSGARICNGWKEDYGRFCIVTCLQNYTLGPGKSFETMYVCGASGSWIAGGPMPDCLVEVESASEALTYQPEYMNFSFEESCYSSTTMLQNLYLDRLRSTNGFSTFCTDYPDECITDNVAVQCGAMTG